MYQRYLQTPLPQVESRLNQSDSPSPSKRVKRGRPFVTGIESRQVLSTSYGKVWNVKREADSGVSSNSSNCEDEDEQKTVANRVERIMNRATAGLRRDQELSDRMKALENERARLAEEEAAMKKKREETMKKKARSKKEKEARQAEQRKRKALKRRHDEVERQLKLTKDEIDDENGIERDFYHPTSKFRETSRNLNRMNSAKGWKLAKSKLKKKLGRPRNAPKFDVLAIESAENAEEEDEESHDDEESDAAITPKITDFRGLAKVEPVENCVARNGQEAVVEQLVKEKSKNKARKRKRKGPFSTRKHSLNFDYWSEILGSKSLIRSFELTNQNKNSSAHCVSLLHVQVLLSIG